MLLSICQLSLLVIMSFNSLASSKYSMRAVDGSSRVHKVDSSGLFTSTNHHSATTTKEVPKEIGVLTTDK